MEEFNLKDLILKKLQEVVILIHALRKMGTCIYCKVTK